eukprot:449930_1
MSQLLVDRYTRELHETTYGATTGPIQKGIQKLCFAYYCSSIQYPKYNVILPSITPKPINNKLPKIKAPNEICMALNTSDLILFDKINKKFGDKINDFYPDDLLRFVQGYSHEVEREKVTYSRINDLINIGSEFNFEKILKRNIMSENTEKICLNTWPLFMYGYDNEGHPIMYDEGCNANPTELESCFSIDDKFKKMKTFRFRFLKRLHNVKRIQTMRYGYDGTVNKKGGLNFISKHCMVIDLSQFSIWNLNKFKNLMGDIIGSESNLYPNTLEKTYLINAPWVFRTGWGIIKSFVHPITQKKIEILGSDYIKTMVKRISIDHIPKKYGGKGKLGPIKLGYAADIENEYVDGHYSLQCDPVDLKTIQCVKNKNY